MLARRHTITYTAYTYHFSYVPVDHRTYRHHMGNPFANTNPY